MKLIFNNHIAGLVHKNHITGEIPGTRYLYRISAPIERVCHTKQLAKLSLNYSIGRTHS